MNKHRVDCRSGWKCNAFPKFLNITPTVKQAEAKHRTGIALPKQNLAHHASASRMIRKKQHSHLELFVGENDKEEEQKHEHQHCLHMWCLFIFCLYALFPLCFAVFLTFSLSDGGGLVGGAWVCVAFETPQMPPTVSGTGLRELSITEAACLGLASPALSTARKKREGEEEGVRMCGCSERGL